MRLRGLDAGNRFVHTAVRAIADGVPLPQPPHSGNWTERAGQHGVLSVLAADLETDQELRSVRLQRAERHLRTLADLHFVQEALDEAGIDWLVFKGPVLSEVVYQHPGTRNYGDLDILVRPQDTNAAVDALTIHGADLHDADLETLRAGGRGEMNMLLPNGTHLDLHWDVVNSVEVRRSFSVSIDKLLLASRDIRLGRLTVRTYSEIDTVLHIALHSAISGGDRLRWLLDLHQSLVRCDAPIAELLERARSFGLELILRVMVNRVAAFVDARQRAVVPRPSLARRSWLAADALAIRMRPPGSLWQGRLSAAVLVHSTRPSPGASWVALSRAVGYRIRVCGHSRDRAGNRARPTTAL